MIQEGYIVFQEIESPQTIEIDVYNGTSIMAIGTSGMANMDITIEGLSDLKRNVYAQLALLDMDTLYSVTRIMKVGSYQLSVAGISKLKIKVHTLNGGRLTICARGIE